MKFSSEFTKYKLVLLVEMDSALFPSTSKDVVVLKPVSKLNAMKHFICTILSENYDNKSGNTLIHKAYDYLNKTTLYLQLTSVKLMDTCFSSNTLAPLLVSHHVISSDLNTWIDNGFLQNFNELPNELVAKIFSYLPGDEVQNVQFVCRRFKKILDSYRSIMQRQEMDCLEMIYTCGKWHVAQPYCSDSINLFSVKKRKQYMGTTPFPLKNYNIFKLRIQFDSINQEVLQNLQLNKITARRVNLHVNYEDDSVNINLTKDLIIELSKNSNVGKIHVVMEYTTQQECLIAALNCLKSSISKLNIEIPTRSRSSPVKFGF
uniref:F-box domain-containing protein n=1 Tax=Acrobeloides nanus TaxID=290746 RepID=A0A914DK90_9BILA